MLAPLSTRSIRRGFTLVELAIVVMIIGVLLAFILAASYGSVEQARSRATQALITKLELGVNERLNAILAQSVIPTSAHQWLAADQAIVNNALIPSIPNPSRAQVIATVDMVRAELPDVFFLQSDGNYPINFAGLPVPGNALGVAGSVPAPYAPGYGHGVCPPKSGSLARFHWSWHGDAGGQLQRAGRASQVDWVIPYRDRRHRQ